MGGALLGALLAQVLSSVLVQFWSSESQTIFVDLSLNWMVLGFTSALAFATTLLFGLLPALKATQTSPGEALRSGARDGEENPFATECRELLERLPGSHFRSDIGLRAAEGEIGV